MTTSEVKQSFDEDTQGILDHYPLQREFSSSIRSVINLLPKSSSDNSDGRPAYTSSIECGEGSLATFSALRYLSKMILELQTLLAELGMPHARYVGMVPDSAEFGFLMSPKNILQSALMASIFRQCSFLTVNGCQKKSLWILWTF